MNDEEFEGRLRTLLNERVDVQVGGRRPAPPFEVPQVTGGGGGRRRAPWLTPLVAAACVAAVVGGGLGLSRIVADDKGDRAVDRPTVSSQPQPTHPPSPTAGGVTPTPRHSMAPAPLTSTAPTTTHPSPPANRHVVVLNGARISLPDAVTKVRQTGSDGYGVWCLGHAAAGTASSTCQAILETNTADPAYSIYPDSIGGGFGDAGEMDCSHGGGTYVAPKLALLDKDLTFGGRDADWREWTYTCGGDVLAHYEQYAVDSAPGWVLYSDSSDPATSALLAGIAEYSVLPAQTRPLRLTDNGILRSATPHGSTVTITIDREIESGPVTINTNPKTYTYEVPASIFDTAVSGTLPPKIGDVVALTTNGFTVKTLNT